MNFSGSELIFWCGNFLCLEKYQPVTLCMCLTVCRDEIYKFTINAYNKLLWHSQLYV